MNVHLPRTPSVAKFLFLVIEDEIAKFRQQLDQNSDYPRGPADAERFLFCSKALITSWRDQLNFLLTYINQDLKPKFKKG